MALASEKKYARICAHSGPDDPLQQMLIALHKDARVRLHYHEYEESLYIVEGEGVLRRPWDEVELKDGLSYRIPPQVTHQLLATTEWLVFIETSPGPWRKERTTWLEPSSSAPQVV